MMSGNKRCQPYVLVLLFVTLSLSTSPVVVGQNNGDDLLLVFRSVTWGEYATLLQANLSTGEVVPFIDNENIYVIDMEWSPDGERLAALAVHDFPDEEPSHFDLCVFTFEGILEICFNAVARPRPIAWTPDGESVLFVSDWRDDTLYLSVANLQDGTIQPIWERTWRDFISVLGPVWAPDARRFAVRVEVDEDPSPEVVRVAASFHIFDLATDTIEPNVEIRGLNTLWWSADGRYLALGSAFLSPSAIYDIESDELLRPNLIHQESQLQWHLATWSHFGHRFAFFGYEANFEPSHPGEVEHPELFVYDLDVGELQPLGYRNRGAQGPLSWSPDDKYIAVSAVTSRGGASELVVVGLDGETWTFRGEGDWNELPVWLPVYTVSKQ
jgi:Tol biopolymer transport system component